MSFQIKRTTASDEDFRFLVSLLDKELWDELKEDQATYDPHNKVDHIETVVVVYDGIQPVACGCFKNFDETTVEIKRMFVQKNYRGKGLSKLVLQTLEQWAAELGYRSSVLETSVHFATACGLYRSKGYRDIPKYGPYVGLEDSVCMGKDFI